MKHVKYISWTPQSLATQLNAGKLFVDPKPRSPDLVAIATLPKSWETTQRPKKRELSFNYKRVNVIINFFIVSIFLWDYGVREVRFQGRRALPGELNSGIFVLDCPSLVIFSITKGFVNKGATSRCVWQFFKTKFSSTDENKWHNKHAY